MKYVSLSGDGLSSGCCSYSFFFSRSIFSFSSRSCSKSLSSCLRASVESLSHIELYDDAMWRILAGGAGVARKNVRKNGKKWRNM